MHFFLSALFFHTNYKNMKKKFLLKIAALMLTIMTFVHCKNETKKPVITKITPDQYLKLKEKINKKTIIHFWWSYCEPCIKDMPKLLSVSKKNKVEIVNISCDKSDSKMQDNLEKVMEKLNVKDCFIIDYNNLYPNGTKNTNVLGDFAKKINLKDYNSPYYILINENGKEIVATDDIQEIEDQFK